MNWTAWVVEPFGYGFMVRAAVATVAVCVAAPLCGIWALSRRLVYLTDSMSHGVLAGVAGASIFGYIITTTKVTDDVAAMVRSPGHQEFITTGCTHFLSPAVVTIHGDDAVAVCESTLLLRRGATYEAIRAGVSYFHLRRAAESPHGWQIVKRVTRLLDGTELPRRLLADGIAGRILR